MSDSSQSYNMGFSSRIKKIFIELHGYTFFHGPSEMRHIDKRFIGRKNIINKLKAILINSDTRSGAYLVTGYRGMGKSSFVGKVIDEIDPSNRRSIPASRYGRILVILLFLSIFQTLELTSYFNSVFLLLPLIAWSIILIYLPLKDRGRDTLKLTKKKNSRHPISRSWLSRVGRCFLVSIDTDSEYIYRRFIRMLFISLTIYLATWLAESLFFPKENNFKLRFWSYIILLLIVILINHISRILQEIKKPETRAKFKKCKRFCIFIETFWNNLKQKVKNYFNYSRRIYIKINLGYDDLKEIDILRLISRSIEVEYKKFRKLSSKNLPYTFFKFIFLYLFVGILYYYGPVYELNKEFKEVIGFNEYFPSQAINENGKMGVEGVAGEIARFRGGPVKKAIIYADGLVEKYYKKFLDFVLFGSKSFHFEMERVLAIDDISSDFKLIPPRLDYFFLFYLLAFFWFFKYLLKPRVEIGSEDTILRKIKDLNEIIDFQITREQGGAVSTNRVAHFSFSTKKIKLQSKATIREIEKRLIEILEGLDRFSKFSVKPEFVFIFDELDKIEPHENISISQREAEEPDLNGQPETTYFATEGVRKRQHTIFKILSNLKHFLNTAKAKFIFIAGRELYDAALADVSDRNFFIGSIFHDVIYVNSFMTDLSDKRSSDIASMTEKYVCQFLFPPYYDVKEHSLKEYKKFLENYYSTTFDSDTGESKIDAKNHNLEIEKIIFTLRNFITYLTYRSNGAPKKMTNYFENYIYKPKDEEELTSDLSLSVGFNHQNLFLRFRYYEQYTFGMISYLVMPVILSVSDSIKDYGDKLLVSTSFLVDHLYKFHKNGFSWRNIELTPEIVDINKAPQLREFISLIISNLSNTHLMEIVKGLYTFKFRKKISEEIDFLSKIEEREAAAFNFTLDESLSLKRHHKKLLRDLKKTHKQTHLFNDKEEYINSISFIHMIIGDLHFYDEEYNDAIVEYMEATESLRKIDFTPQNVSYFMLFVRNMLKLGFTLEKRKSYSAAFMIYGQLVTAIINFRDIDLTKLGLIQKKTNIGKVKEYKNKRKQEFRIPVNTEKLELRKGKQEFFNLLVKDDSLKSEFKHSFWHNESSEIEQDRQKRQRIFREEIDPELFDPQKDKAICLSEDFKDLIHEVNSFTCQKENLLFKTSAFEGIRLMFQPLQAKLQMIEKANLGGITISDLTRIENEFNFLTKTIKYDEKYLIAAEFWAKIGDILYFKNGLHPFYHNRKEEKDNGEYYCQSKNTLCSCNPNLLQNSQKESYLAPCRSCEYYMKSFQKLCVDFIGLPYKTLEKQFAIPELYFRSINRNHLSKNSMGLQVLANTLSGIGNNFFSCCTNEQQISEKFLGDFLEFVRCPSYHFEIFFTHGGCIPIPDSLKPNELKQPLRIETLEYTKNNFRKFNKLEEVFLYYFLSYRYYINVGQQKEASVQILKILYVIRNLLRQKDNYKFKKYVFSQLPNIKKALFQNGIKNLYRAYKNVHRFEIEIYKRIFNYKLSDDEPIDIQNISLNADFRELFFVVEEIALMSQDKKEVDLLALIKNCRVTPYSTVNRMYNRILELKFKALLNYKIFERLEFVDIMAKVDEENSAGPRSQEKILEKIKQRIASYGSKKFKVLLNKCSQNVDTLDQKVIAAMEFLIIDSIYCYLEITKILQISGITYMMNYSILALAHEHLGDWCEYYFLYIKNSPDGAVDRISNNLGHMIGVDGYRFVATKYHYEKAKAAYYSLLELHGEGKAYRDMIENMFYLNDDFNDTIYHFHAAAERYRISTGKIRKKLIKLKRKIKDTSVYEFDNYQKRWEYRTKKPGGKEEEKKSEVEMVPQNYQGKPAQ